LENDDDKDYDDLICFKDHRSNFLTIFTRSSIKRFFTIKHVCRRFMFICNRMLPRFLVVKKKLFVIVDERKFFKNNEHRVFGEEYDSYWDSYRYPTKEDYDDIKQLKLFFNRFYSRFESNRIRKYRFDDNGFVLADLNFGNYIKKGSLEYFLDIF